MKRGPILLAATGLAVVLFIALWGYGLREEVKVTSATLRISGDEIELYIDSRDECVKEVRSLALHQVNGNTYEVRPPIYRRILFTEEGCNRTTIFQGVGRKIESTQFTLTLNGKDNVFKRDEAGRLVAVATPNITLRNE